MVDWLSRSLAGSGTIVTANRRLARSLSEEFNTAQTKAGRTAWRSPRIYSWQDWCHKLIALAPDQGRLPTRINAQQSEWLWERCLRLEVADDAAGYVNLVRLARDTWQRLADWQVSIKRVAAAAQSADQRMFVAAAGRYLAILEKEHWIDDAGSSALLLHLIEGHGVVIDGTTTFAGFDRQRPIDSAIQAALGAAGVSVAIAPTVSRRKQLTLQSYDSVESELRASGAWARRKINADSACRIAIISNDLVGAADKTAGQVREGLVPGWQYGHASLHDALNVSYGRKLVDFPAVSVALLTLRWLHRELTAAEVGILMRSPLLSAADLAPRSRLELQLRQLPDRNWSPAMITAALRSKDDGGDGHEWLADVAKLTKRRREIPATAAPAEWALFIDETLRLLGWPGRDTLESVDYQLINRWRELLNELARLDLISEKMSFSTALSRLEILAGETVFQSELVGARVQLMGPLEAAGAEFDAVWILGLSSNHWPPVARPSVLLSRRLQESCAMPDCTPADTTRFARDLLQRLTDSADEVRCSFAVNQDDSEQTASSLLLELQPVLEDRWLDPGWHATTLLNPDLLVESCDRVPQVTKTEKLSGGAAVIQQQVSDPISAFINSRLGARAIYPQVVGISPLLRGNLIHDAMYALYRDRPDRNTIAKWHGAELDTRVDAAVDFAFSRHERQLDLVLKQMFVLERRRVVDLLARFVVVDAARDDFKIVSVEDTLGFVAGDIRLSLRSDRIDLVDGDRIVIIDYKTGAKKRLWNREREPLEIQLFVYAMATDADVAALALANIDSREVAFDGAGLGYGDSESWPLDLQRIQKDIESACAALQQGDVRINKTQGMQSARSLSVLSRYAELRNDNG